MPVTDPVRAQIESLVTGKSVVLFMKGNRQFPQCGFSAQVCQILDEVAGGYDTVNVLADPAMRDGIKEYSSWPTIPQLYVRGQFVGGCDIVKEMYASGELQKLLGDGPAPEPPRLSVSPRAAAAIGEASADAGEEILRLVVAPSFETELYFDAKKEGDFLVDCGGLSILVDRGSARRATGIAIDFVEGPKGAGFKIDNPNEPPRVRPLAVKELAARFDAGEALHLFDVRPEVERKRASIARAHALDAHGVAELEGLPKDAPIVFHCHHGIRSRAAAEEAIRRGFTKVYNLEGGIDAWSQDVDARDPSILKKSAEEQRPAMSDHPTDFKGSVTEAIAGAIGEKIEGARVDVTGGAGHYTIVVTSKAFAGKSPVDSQRMVYAAIAHLMKGDLAPVHAIDSLRTITG